MIKQHFMTSLNVCQALGAKLFHSICSPIRANKGMIYKKMKNHASTDVF